MKAFNFFKKESNKKLLIFGSFFLLLASVLVLSQMVLAQEEMESSQYKIKDLFLEIKKTDSFQNIPLIKKEGDKEEIIGQAKIVDQYLISDIPENEFLDEYPYLKSGFQNLSIDVEADQPIFDKENFHHPPSLLDKTGLKLKSFLGIETQTLPEYRLIKEINKSQSIQAKLDLSKITLITDYKKTENSSQQVKQTITLKNNSEQDLNLSLLLENRIDADKIYWNDEEYSISENAQKFENPAKISFYAKKGEYLSFYDYSDVPEEFLPELWLEKQNSESFLILSLNIFIPAFSSKIIDPIYGADITILNVHSHPQAGDDWTVSFETIGMDDLTITPDDQQSIDDLDFISLTCDGQECTPQILEGDVIFYPDWSCEGIGEVVHLVNVARDHVLKFQFGDEIAYAYNSPGWYSSNWLYRKEITIDNTLVDDDLTDFPVLVSTTSNSDLASHAQPDGDDILFTSSDEVTKIPHEIEKYASSTGELVAWVKTDLSSSTDTTLYMYYGNSGASDQQQATSVWDDNFKGVWHISENATGTRYDSTGNNNDGTPTYYENDEATSSGKIDGADYLDGDNDHIRCGSGASLDITGKVTLSAWAKADSASTEQIINKYWNTYSIGFTSTRYFSVSYRNQDNGQYGVYSDGPIDLDKWYYFVGVIDSSGNVSTYLNGQHENSEAFVGTSINSNPTRFLMIGCGGSGNDYFFGGTVDEVHVSSTTRSAAWISTSYNNQTSTSAFMSFGAEEVYSTAPLVGTVILNSGNDITLTENATTTVFATTTVADIDGYADISSIEGKIFRSGAGSGCSTDDNNCYLDSACATSSCDGDSCTATCEYEVYFHADPTDASSPWPTEYWEAWIKAIDTDNASSTATSNSQELNTLHALSISASTINYGSIAPGDDTGTLNQGQAVTNTGNASIDFYLYGTYMASSTSPSWYSSNWLYRKKITIDNTQVDDDLTDFPVLVSTTSADLSSKTQPDGDDILFTQSDGTTKLNHEIEYYASSTGELVAWVKSDLASTTDTDIYMYYGYSWSDNQQNAASVWDDNYMGVWHLGEASGTRNDSTSRGNNLTETSGTIDSTTTDVIAGRAADFEADDTEQLLITDAAQNGLDTTGPMTLSAWIKAESQPGGWRNFLSKDGGWYFAEDVSGAGHRLKFSIWSASDVYGSTTLDIGTWYYVNAVYSGSQILLYVNGELDNTPPSYSSGISTTSVGFSIGNKDAQDQLYGHDGLMDEVRFSSTTRSAAWISTSYNSQSSTAAFMDFGSEESPPLIPVENQEYATSSGISYGSGTNATSSTNHAVEVDLTKPTSYPSTSTQNVYWGIGIPADTEEGAYNGSHTYETKSD